MAMIRRSNSRFVFRSGSLLAVLVVSLAGQGRANAQTWNRVPSQSDEFNGPANSPIDSTRWRFDYGNLNVNHELEWYCGPVGDPQNMPPCDSTKPNIFIDGSGHLVFLAFRINNTLVNGSWTSSRMQTHGTMTFLYGRLEASMQLPVGAGLWPAFWALGSNFATVSLAGLRRDGLHGKRSGFSRARAHENKIYDSRPGLLRWKWTWARLHVP